MFFCECTLLMMMHLSLCVIVDVCFFNEKTAYVVRISDWSSDVCSSDLCGGYRTCGARSGTRSARYAACPLESQLRPHHRAGGSRGIDARHRRLQRHVHGGVRVEVGAVVVRTPGRTARRGMEGVRSGRAASRSEEHKSELQSLMRISYAVFCLKKKKMT